METPEFSPIVAIHQALANGAEHLEVAICYCTASCRPNRRWINSKGKSMQECRSTVSSQRFLKDSRHPRILCQCSAGVGGLAALFHEGLDIYNADHRMESRCNIAKVPTLAAMSYRKSIGKSFVDPDPSLGYAENFLNMCLEKQGNLPRLAQPSPVRLIASSYYMLTTRMLYLNCVWQGQPMQPIRGDSGGDCRLWVHRMAEP